MVRNTSAVLDHRASLALLYAVSFFLSAQFGAEIGRLARWVHRHVRVHDRPAEPAMPAVPSYLVGPDWSVDVVGFGPPGTPAAVSGVSPGSDADPDDEFRAESDADVAVSEASAA